MKALHKNSIALTGFAAALLILVAAGFLSYRNMRAMAESDIWENHTYVVIENLDRLLLALDDVETGQRGYIITGKDDYLQPYDSALRTVDAKLDSLTRLTRDNPSQQERLERIKRLANNRLATLKATLEQRRTEGFHAAAKAMLSGTGKRLMDELRRQVTDAQAEEEMLLQQRAQTKTAATRATLRSFIAGSLLGLALLVAIFTLLIKEIKRRTSVEDALRMHQARLEELVDERTRDLARSKDKLENLLQSMGDAFVSLDCGWRYTFVNDKALALMAKSREELLGKVLWEVFPETVGTVFDAELHHVMNKREPAVFEPYYSPYKMWLEIHAYPHEEGIAIFYTDITERKQAEQALRESENRLKILNETLETIVVRRTREVRELATALTLAEQRERQRLSLLLHEDLQQILFSATLRIDMLAAGAGNSPEAREDIDEVKRLTHKAIKTAKTLAAELNPPILKLEGLDAAIKWLAQHFVSHYGLDVTTEISEPFRELDVERRILLVQLVRELLMNVVKHAKTASAKLSALRCDDSIVITIVDKGKGFDLEQVRRQHTPHEYFGLFGIEERLRLIGGRLELSSAPGKGTVARIVLPFPAK